MLAVNNLTYSFRNKLIFNNLSASFSDGEVVGITGNAGSGKSVFINLLSNKQRDYEGNIIIDNYNIKKTDKKIIKNLISHYSSLHKSVNPEAIVKEWILAGRIHHKKRLSPYSDIDKEIAFNEMTNFGLNQVSDIRLKLISETFRNMASIARVFSAQSKLLLLEKPDAGLNINQRVLLSKCIKKYTLSGNNIVVLTSGDLNFIAATCDKIIVLDDNVIAESGTHRIITGELIKKYYNIDAVVTKNIYSGLPEIQIIEEN
ncbi:MAG TPA: ABC transporter ATP-binding protein [Spirochaetota bacterium]|nr:ABC transporter ATP-binding protein [Spirochaetota bacterium]HPS86033.1 ABC transporter ATP-binding protein [Spirochaetota bacterium]